MYPSPRRNLPINWMKQTRTLSQSLTALMTTFYIQVKMHEGETSGWGVEQISKYYEQHGRCMDGYTAIPWVISSGTGFSEEAVALAQEKGVRLIDGAEFARMLVDVGIVNIDQAFEQS